MEYLVGKSKLLGFFLPAVCIVAERAEAAGCCGSGMQLSGSTGSPLRKGARPHLSLLLALVDVGQCATLTQFTGVAEDGSWVVFVGLPNQTVTAKGSTSAKTISRKA